MLKPVHIVILCSLAILFIILFGCNKKDNNDPEGGWSLGDKTSIQVSASPGEELTESTHNLIFYFPEGASCTIEVADILEGEEPPIEGRGYYFNFPANENVCLVFPDDTTKRTFVWGWGINPGTTHNVENTKESWVAIPHFNAPGNRIAFNLLMPQDMNFKNSQAVHSGFNYVYIAQIDKNSTFWEKENLVAADLANMIRRYTDSLAPELKEVVQNRIFTEIPYQFSLGSEPCYLPFWWTAGGYVIRASLTIDKSLIDPVQITASVAHESGHYMMHVLGGNDTYLTLYRQMPQNTLHGPGTIANRSSYMVEESAYFSEYFHTGKVSSASNPEEPRMLLWDMNNMPIKADYPGIEGFGVAMLASLHRTNSQMYSVWETTNKLVTVDAPVIGAPFSDIFGIMAKGATNMDQLRTHVTQYLVTIDKDDLLSPLLQRLGWGYYVDMRIVDKNGAPLAGVKARNLCMAGGKTWYGGYYSTPTGNDGNYTLPGEVFGGTSTLRFYQGTDSLDVEINIDWTRKTDETIHLGDITVDFTNILPPHLENKDYGFYIGSFWQYECPNVVNIPTGYIPRNYNASGEYITCHSNGVGSIEFTFNNPASGETCTGSGTVLPHHIDNSGWFPINFYSFNLTFEYKFTPDGVPFYKYTGTITGVDRLDAYFTSRLLQCEGTMTLYWFDNQQQLQSCSYAKNFNNQTCLHNY